MYVCIYLITSRLMHMVENLYGCSIGANKSPYKPK